ncbi:Ig-like domain-containing protein [Caldicellulosiruptor morganii]|nr:Ig-like domain-containing protein [Caldicellulosiruptor morganii]
MAAFAGIAANTQAYEQAAQVLKQKGVMTGDTKGNLNLDRPLKRSEIAKMMIILLGKKPLADFYANQKKSSFKDVASSHWALGYIEACRNIGLITGYPDGTFKPDQYLKMEELTAIVIRSLGIKENELKGKYPLNYIRKAYDLGIYSGIEAEIETGKLATRGQTAVILYNAFLNQSLKEAKPVSIEAIDSTTVKITFDRELKTLDRSSFAFDSGLSVLDVRFADSTKKVVEIKTATQQEGKEYTFIYKGQTTALKFTSKVIPFGLSEDIKAENLKKIDIKFTKAISQSQIDSLPIKVYVNDKEDSTAKFAVSQDFRTVSIVFQNKLNQGDRVRIVISNLMSETGQSFSVTKEVSCMDTIQPKVVDFKVINSKKFKVIFNEPVDSSSNGSFKVCDIASAGATIKVDGNYLYAKVTPKYEENAIEIENYTPLSDGSHTIEISDAKDFAGYKMVYYTTTFTTTLDRTAPKHVALNLLANNRLQLVFDEEIRTIDGSTPTGEYEVYQASDSTNHAIGAKITLLSDGKTVDIALNPALKLDVRALVSFEVRYRNVEDLLGNKTTEWTIVSSKASDDTTKPSVKSVEVLDGNIVKVTFSENVNAKDRVSSFKLLSSDGQTILDQVAKSVSQLKENDYSTYLVEFSSLEKVNGGSYILKISGIADVSVRENVMDDAALSFDAKDTLPPTITAAIAKYDSASDNDKIDIFFSETMDVEKLKNLSNYFIGNGTATIPISSIRGAKVDYISPSANRVTIIVPGADDRTPGKWSSAGGVVDRLAAPTLTDTAGNFLANATIAMPYLILANFKGVSPQDIEVLAIDKNTIQIKALNDYIFASFDPASIMFRNAQSTTSLNGNPDNDKIISLGIVSYVISPDKKMVTLKTAVSLTSDARADTNDTGQEPEELKIYTTGSGIKDQFDQVLTIPPTLDVNFYPNIKLKDRISSQQLSISAGTGQNSDTIVVAFDEPIMALPGINSTILAAGIELKDGSITLLPDTDYTAYTQNGVLYIKVKKPGIVDRSISVEIKRPDLIVDLNGNPAAASKAQVVDHVTERVAPDVSAEFSTTDTRKVKLTFSEPMDPATLTSQNFSCVAGGSITGFTKSPDNRVVEITFTNPLPQGSIVNISPNVRDLAGNSVLTQAVKK